MAEYIDRQLCETAADYDEHYRLIVPLSKIRKFPSADVAPVVHGKWGLVNEDRYRCDRCEQITTVDECMGKPNYNFCPNCGAKMDGGTTP